MENEKMNQERISPYAKKPFATKSTLLNILLFFIFVGINTFMRYLDDKPTINDSRDFVFFLMGALGYMTIYALIGFVFAYGIYRKKDKQEKNKYGLIFSILITLLFLLVDMTNKSEEVTPYTNKIVSEQSSNESPAVSEQKSDKFYSEAGKYSIKFPGIPKIENIEIDTAKGKNVMHQSLFSNNKAEYGINYFDDSEEVMTEERINNQLISARDGSINNVNGILIESKFFNFISPSKSKSYGIDFSAKIGNSRLYLGRIIRIKNRIYHLMIIPKTNEFTESEMNTFINSFYSDY